MQPLFHSENPMSVEVIESIEQFDTTIAAGNVVVDFYADWCGPCKALSPIFEEVAGEHTDTKFVKVNVDKVDVAKRFGVRGIPTVMRFEGGQPVKTKVGAITKANLQAFLQA